MDHPAGSGAPGRHVIGLLSVRFRRPYQESVALLLRRAPGA